MRGKRMRSSAMKKVTLGGRLGIEEFVAGCKIWCSDRIFRGLYRQGEKNPVLSAQKWVDEGPHYLRRHHGIWCAVHAVDIKKRDTAALQKNILLSHATSVGQPLSTEQVRGTILMVLQNIGQGYSGVTIKTADMYRQFLNLSITPFAPGEGSVGYLCPEAHIALALIGEGQAYFRDQLMPSKDALAMAGLPPTQLTSKEGLALVSGTTSVTAIGALALYDMITAAKSADIIGAMALEVLKGNYPRFRMSAL